MSENSDNNRALLTIMYSQAQYVDAISINQFANIILNTLPALTDAEVEKEIAGMTQLLEHYATRSRVDAVQTNPWPSDHNNLPPSH